MLIKALSRISPAVAIGSSWERMSPRRQTAPATVSIVRRTRWIVFPTIGSTIVPLTIAAQRESYWETYIAV